MKKNCLLFPILILIAFFHPLSIFSVEEQPVEHSTEHEGWTDEVLHQADNFQSKFMNMILMLALLIGFMILASWSLKRMMKSRITQMNQSSKIKVLETRQLSPKAVLYLVDVDGSTHLIGESATSLNHLATLPGEKSC